MGSIHGRNNQESKHKLKNRLHSQSEMGIRLGGYNLKNDISHPFVILTLRMHRGFVFVFVFPVFSSQPRNAFHIPYPRTKSTCTNVLIVYIFPSGRNLCWCWRGSGLEGEGGEPGASRCPRLQRTGAPGAKRAISHRCGWKGGLGR